jgi:hypothetical protein
MRAVPCVFCQKKGPLSDEHIFPKWLQPHLADPEGEDGTHRRMSFRSGDAEVYEHSYRGQPATVVVKSVCKGCNNGWMASLEGAAKPYLLSMIRGNTRAYYEHGQALIATWFVKTALVAGSKFKPSLPADFYSALIEDRRPTTTTHVWLAGTPYDAHHQSDFRPIRVQTDGKPPPPEPNAFSAMIVVGQLVGFVVSWLDAVPSTDRVMQEFGPALIPIWSVTEPTVTWPPRAGRLDFAALDALANTVVAVDDVIAGRGRPNS